MTYIVIDRRRGAPSWQRNKHSQITAAHSAAIVTDIADGAAVTKKKSRALHNRYTSVTKEEARAALAASSAARRPEARPS